MTSRIDTAATRAGEDRKSSALSEPIWQTAPFAFASVADLEAAARGDRPDHFYSRYGNPSVRAAEVKMAALEGSEDAVLFGSGMAAVSTTLLTLLTHGDHLLAIEDLYGGASVLIDRVLPTRGISATRVATAVMPEFEPNIRAETRAIYVETPTNPLVKIVDLASTAAFAKSHGLLAIIDGTFASPVLQKPLEAGFDVVLHSATKYLNGHADVTAGFACASASICERLRQERKLFGAILDPHAAWLLTRGMKTVALRVRAQSASALEIAQKLSVNPAIHNVHYPGLPSHPGHETARRQMRAFGAMLAFDVAGGAASARRFVESLRLMRLATSLGSVETTVDLPAITSHSPAMLAPEKREALGIRDSTVRLSVGAEDVADLLDDLTAALARSR